MKIKLRFGSLKKWLIFIMVACILVLAGLIITSPMLDNSDPITSGEYMMSDPIPIPVGPHPSPIPEVKVDPENTPDTVDSEGNKVTVEKLERIADATVEAGKELIDEVSKEFSGPEAKKKGKKIGGLTLGTLFTLYLGYRFIFK